MKNITIPERFGYPTAEITINGVEKAFASGVEISVEDSVAEAIENAIALTPKPGRNKSRLAQLAEGSITELTASDLDGVEAIYQFAFYYCDTLQSVVIPNNVKSIGYSAFRHCGGLKRVEIPGGVLNIDDKAFDNCISLARVILKVSKPPIIQPETFANIPPSCIFEVPFESVAAYKSAMYWGEFANRIVASEE